MTFEIKEEEIRSVSSDVVPSFPVSNPFQDQTPRDILTRWRSLGTCTLGLTDSAGDQSFTYSDLVNDSMFKGVLQTFRYFRYKAIEFRVQYTTVPMVYGWMGMTCLPHRYARWDSDEIQMLASHDDSVLLDFSLQQDVIMTSTWKSYDSWLDLTELPPSEDAVIDRWHLLRLFWPQHPLRSIQSTAQSIVTLQIFGRFIEPEVAGPIVNNESSFEAQSGTPINAQSLYNAGMAMYAGYQMFNSISSVASTQSIPGPSSLMCPIEGEATQNVELKPNPYGSLYFSPDKFLLGDGSMIPNPARQRRNTISEFVSQPTLTAFGILPESDTGRLVGVMDPYPETTEVYTVNAQPRYSRLLWMAQIFRMWRGSVKYTIVFFANAFISGRLNIVLNYGARDEMSGLLRSEIIQDVTIRGTTRVDFVVPYLSVSPWMPNWFYGDQTLEFFRRSVPWLGFRWLNVPQSVGDIQPTLPYLIFESAGPDFEYRSLINPCSQSVVESFQAQMRVAELKGGEVIAGGSMPKIQVDSVMQSTFEELASRWSWRDPSEYLRVQPHVNYKQGIFDFCGNTFLGSSGQTKFKASFFPGEELPYTRVTAKLNNGKKSYNSEEYLNTIDIREHVEDGMATIDVALTRVMEFTVPFVSTREFYNLDTIAAPSCSVSNKLAWWDAFLMTDKSISPAASEMYVAAGKDFCLYMMVPPPYPVRSWPGYYLQPVVSTTTKVEKIDIGKKSTKVSSKTKVLKKTK